MLDLARDTLQFSFPGVHPEARLSVSFQRTLRLPDDGKEYPLPPGLGNFPLRHVDEFKDRVPPKWLQHGGVMMPLYQSEALWLHFNSSDVARQGRYPFVMKIAAGKVSALTGEEWKDGLQPKDYCVIPNQPWLDGYVVEDGLVRQFIAAPLGSGFSAEEQITGKAEHGGIQIEVYPMKREVFDRRFPKRPERLGGIIRSMGLRPASANSANGGDWEGSSYTMDSMMLESTSFNAGEDAFGSDDLTRGIQLNSDMGLAAGGKMKQQVLEDPYDINDWDLTQRSRCFIHLANSLVWRAITKQEPPSTPRTAADYSRYGLPWFDYYTDDVKSLQGSGKLKGLKSVLEMGFQKGVQILPENQSIAFKSDQIHVLGDQRRKDEVRAGTW
jgi:hypothetical protein